MIDTLCFLLFFAVSSLNLTAFADSRPSSSAKGEAVKNSEVVKNEVMMADPNKVPAPLENVGVKERVGEKVDLQNLEFISAADGKPHRLAEFTSNGKPTLLNLVYFSCPMLCTLVLNGVLDGMKGLDYSIGKEFNVLTISIDPREGPADGSAKKANYLASYLEKAPNRDAKAADAGWHFFTGSETQIQKLADQLGFQFKYDEVQKEYAHPAVTYILTQDGVISRNLYGVQYRPRDLRFALLEAARGKIGNVFDRFLMFCYHYEPSARGYTLQAVRVMQVGASLTFLFLFGYLALFWARQSRLRKGNTA